MKQCPRCHNTDPRLFALRDGEMYCRACIHLLGKCYEDESDDVGLIDPELSLDYELTPQQKKLSDELKNCGLLGDTLVEAVCGAGKTEISLGLVQKALDQGLKVGWMVARRQVVLQLGERLSQSFKELKVICITSGYTEDLEGDLIVLTAHQLYRYPHYFDLLIIDEPDAFPYKGNTLLEGLVEVSCKGTKVYLTATPNDELVSSVNNHLRLDSRPHQRPLVIPTVFKSFKSLNFIFLVYKFFKMDKVLIFVPSKTIARKLGFILRLPVVTSECKNKDNNIDKFSKGQVKGLVCTTILERGVTFKGVNVMVYEAQHPIFDEASLVQISGRVDRSFDYLGGECVFICSGSSQAIERCLKRLKQHNQLAFGV